MSRADRNRLGKQEKMQVQSDALIGLLTDRGILPDTGIENEKVREARQEEQKNTYHNTMMLLQHYRTIVWHISTVSTMGWRLGWHMEHGAKRRKMVTGDSNNQVLIISTFFLL